MKNYLFIAVLGILYAFPAQVQSMVFRPAAALELPEDTVSQSLPRAEPNDQRITAGRMVDGKLWVDLEAVEAEWFPAGPEGPRIVTPAFAEAGGAPQVPGPLIRAAAGTPILVTIRNTLDRPIAVRGLIDRASMKSTTLRPAGPFPAFAFVEPMIIRPGEIRETNFTPTAGVSSFYFGQTLPPGAGAEAAGPFSRLEEGVFMGALVVDTVSTPPDEQILMITRWGSRDEPNMGISWKMMMNGRTWPFTEQLEYTVGETVRWRVINASLVDHPMHLHGFYFTVDGVGDTQVDTLYAEGERPLVVTQMMQEFSSLRLTWVPERPGNWLFHCHLVRHMSGLQQLAGDRTRTSMSSHDAGTEHHMDSMAGLITGIIVHPASGGEPPDENPAWRIDLWTSEQPDVYDGHPEFAFILQNGPQPPPMDSTSVPGSPLVLTRGEPTEIVVHNRLDFPLSVHWHGLELRSLYDGVGGWSGYPGSVRPPIAPGDSVRVLIQPLRAGTFMYHVHGEPGHELSQGLYGPFLVLEPGETRDPYADRVFMLAARGAQWDATPAINGQTHAETEHFAHDQTYRLRFLHISPDAFKRVRLLKDGKPVRWRPRAKDGADLPGSMRELGPARLGVGVGETYDVEWTPETTGVYVLEVTTEFYPSRGGSVTQRVPFAVGEVDEAELQRSREGPAEPAVLLSAQQRARFTGTFVAPADEGTNRPEIGIAIWEEGKHLYTSGIRPRGQDEASEPDQLFSVDERTFATGRDLDGLQYLSGFRLRFVETKEKIDRVQIEINGRVVLELLRVDELEMSESELRRFVGTYGPVASSGAVRVSVDGEKLTWTDADGNTDRLVPLSSTRFRLENRSGMYVKFNLDSDLVTGLTIVTPSGERIRLMKQGE